MFPGTAQSQLMTQGGHPGDVPVDQPLFDAADATQQERIQKVIEKQIPKSIEFLPEVYIQDRNGVREMLSNSVIK